ncbi:Ni/Fe hydrogenase [Candidatus Fermentibacteria bacterium]|nr:MAG: Ni/Fe hydrogenase [Candidatus Fermentibacteria bacterium]
MLHPPINPDLIFTWGNPSRGDDALGPALYDLLQQEELNGVDLLTDFQLQIEHSIDLEGRERVLFVDASTSANAPFELSRLQPEQDASYTTHAMSPQALLSVYQQVNGSAPPPAWLLSIRGYEFGLGLPLSTAARKHLLAAFHHVKELINR